MANPRDAASFPHGFASCVGLPGGGKFTSPVRTPQKIQVPSTATEVIRENEKRSQILLFRCVLPGFCGYAAGRREHPDRQGAGLGPADRQLGQWKQEQWPGGRAERYLWLPRQREGEVVRHLQVGDPVGKRRNLDLTYPMPLQPGHNRWSVIWVNQKTITLDGETFHKQAN
jgi:hypothetical protein